MNTITRFTKEQLIKRLEEQMSSARYALGFVQDSEILRDIEMDLSLAEIARTSLEAKPVLYAAEETLAYAKHGELHLTCLSEPMGDAVIPLYTTPPVQRTPDMTDFRPCPFCNSPVKWCGENSVDPEDDHACHHIQCTNPECGADFDFTNTGDDLLPDDPAILDAMTTTELLQPLRAICKSRFNRRTAPPAPVVPEELLSAMEEVLRISDRDHEAWHKVRNGIASCRAAMLQDSQPVSNRDELLPSIKPAPEQDSVAINAGFPPGNSPVIPDGYVMVPKRLTAENFAKAALSGEFSETKFINCPECFGDDECETCDGSGRIEITVPVSWTNIKAIWDKGVEHFAAAPQQEAE